MRTCNYYRSGCATDPTSGQCKDYDRYVESGMCPPHALFGGVPFCREAFQSTDLTKAKQLVLPEGTWCSTVGKTDCNTAVLSSPSYGTAGETLYQECAWNDEKGKCLKLKDGGYDVVHICSNTCGELTGRSEIDDPDDVNTCNSGSGSNERIADQETCESAYYYREQASGGPSYFPCKFQGVVDGVANPKCHPDFFAPASGCNCVGMSPCQEEDSLQCCKQVGDDYLCYNCDEVV